MVNELDRKNQAIEREVARYRERVAVLAKVKMLEKAIAGRQFEEAKSMYLAAKEGANFIKLRYQAVEAQVKPLKDAYNQALSAYNRIKEEPKKVKEEYNKTANSVDKLYDDNAKLEDSSEDVHVKLRSLDKKEREKQVAITKLNAEIRSLTQSVETLREVHANSNAQRVTIDGEIEEIAEKRRVLNTSNGELQFKLATSKDTADHLKRTREQLQHQLVELKKVKTQKLNAMRRFDESTARAYEWLEQGNNRSRFKGPVVGPISMEISAKEPKYALYLENAIGYNNLKVGLQCWSVDPFCFNFLFLYLAILLQMFLTTCSEDYKLLLRETERMNLRINVACPKEDYLTKSYPRPLNPTQLNQLGFEGLAIDFVEGPDNVLKFLCLTCYLFCVVREREGDGVAR